MRGRKFRSRNKRERGQREKRKRKESLRTNKVLIREEKAIQKISKKRAIKKANTEEKVRGNNSGGKPFLFQISEYPKTRI